MLNERVFIQHLAQSRFHTLDIRFIYLDPSLFRLLITFSRVSSPVENTFVYGVRDIRYFYILASASWLEHSYCLEHGDGIFEW